MSCPTCRCGAAGMGGLRGLSRATPKELLGMKGMKQAKVSSLVAALGLGKRLAVEEIDHLDDWAFRVQAKQLPCSWKRGSSLWPFF